MTEQQTTRRGNLGILAGALFVLLWLAGSIAQSVSEKGTFPRPTDSMAVVHQYFEASSSAIKVNGGLQILSAVALLWFAGFLANFLHRHGRTHAGPAIVAVSGAIAAGTLLVSAATIMSLGASDLHSDAVASQILYQLAFWTGGPLHVAAFGTMILAAAYSLAGLQPQWLRITGIVIGVAGTLASLTAILPPAIAFTPIGRFLGFIWVLITTILLSTRGRTKSDR
jgi:hypothetical protein